LNHIAVDVVVLLFNLKLGNQLAFVPRLKVLDTAADNPVVVRIAQTCDTAHQLHELQE
jgi:hypothetical protein